MTQVETTGSTKTERVAKHILLDAAGNEVEEFEQATGIRYVDLETQESFVSQSGLTAGSAAAMMWCFGARTLATNVASSVRNSKESGGGGEQVLAIRERFSLIDSGVWVDRTREAGVRWDPAKLCAAMVQVAIDGKKLKEKDRDDMYAKLLQKVTDDEKFAASLRQVPGVESEYRKLTGKKVQSVDDILGVMGTTGK